MRALCGAIITAGAVIGLGLTALAIGTRYQNAQLPVQHDKEGNVVKDSFGNPIIEPYLVHAGAMDRPLLFCLVFLTCTAIVGIGIAFVGLAYHHHRRYHELLAAGHIPPHHHTATGIVRADTGTPAPPPM